MKPLINAKCPLHLRVHIDAVLKKIPEHWQSFLPPIEIYGVEPSCLPKRATNIWGKGSVRSVDAMDRNWSVRVTRPIRSGGWCITLSFMSGTAPTHDFMIQKDILSAIFFTMLGKKVVIKTLREVMKHTSLRHPAQPGALLTRELPTFLLKEEVVEMESPELFLLFFRLEKRIQAIANI